MPEIAELCLGIPANAGHFEDDCRVSLFRFWSAHGDELLRLSAEHVALVVASVAIAIAIGVPLGILAARRPRLGAPLVGIANLVQTIPSLALFGFLIPLPVVGGIGARAALVALILYALLPILRTTVAGLRGVDPAVLEAALATGMRPAQMLRLVELPLAWPSMLAGIRVATVVGVGTATIAAAIGAGGLGEYIFRGLSMVDATVMLAGAVPAAALALAADGLLALLERRAAHPQRRARGKLLAVALVAIGALATARALTAPVAVTIGSKNFTEQLVLGELTAQALERWGGLTVDRRLGLGGTFICDRALRAGDIDLYVEYTGTALTAVFKGPVEHDRRKVLEDVRRRYAATGRTVLSPLGFNNTFAILVRGADARAMGLRTISDAAPRVATWRAAFGYEFLERADGFAGLARTYHLRFAERPRVMDLALIYRALANHQVDVIAGDATAGLIDALDLTMLTDDRHYFPPYDAVPVVKTSVLLRDPRIRTALEHLGGRVREEDMRRMNFAAEGGKHDVAEVVKAFLDRLP
jgi:osmoprotectant transport system permease protein